MSLQYQRQKPRDFYIPEICWRCDAPMKIKTIMPSMTFPLLDEVFRLPHRKKADCSEGRQRSERRPQLAASGLGMDLFDFRGLHLPRSRS
jgi:hypothetical protein